MEYKAVRGYTSKRQEHSIKVYCKNELSGKINTMYINMSPAQFEMSFQAWEKGVYIKDAFPNLDPCERDFLLTGLTKEEQLELEEA